MARVKPIGLKPGARIGSYEVQESLGRGWEGEAFLVKEVPTDAFRVMKVIRHDPKKRNAVRDRIHTAWFFEQLSHTGIVARYYHMGQWFLDDDPGLFFFVFEHLAGQRLDRWLRTRPDVKRRMNAAIEVAGLLRYPANTRRISARYSSTSPRKFLLG
jgi:hypothetical protein